MGNYSTDINVDIDIDIDIELEDINATEDEITDFIENNISIKNKADLVATFFYDQLGIDLDIQYLTLNQTETLTLFLKHINEITYDDLHTLIIP